MPHHEVSHTSDPIDLAWSDDEDFVCGTPNWSQSFIDKAHEFARQHDELGHGMGVDGRVIRGLSVPETPDQPLPRKAERGGMADRVSRAIDLTVDGPSEGSDEDVLLGSLSGGPAALPKKKAVRPVPPNPSKRVQDMGSGAGAGAAGNKMFAGANGRLYSSKFNAQRSIENQKKRASQKTNPKPNQRLSDSAIRRFILVTLSHSENAGVALAEACSRIANRFPPIRLIGVQEDHQDGGEHFHVAIENDSASRNTCTRIIRETFPEFPGMGCKVKFHRGWGTMALYVAKDDPSLERAVIMGSKGGVDYTLDRAQQEVSCADSKTTTAAVIIRQAIVEDGKRLEDLVGEPALAGFWIRSANNMKTYAQICQSSIKGKSTLEIIDEGAEQGDASAADAFMNNEQKEALRLFMRQMRRGRRPREPQPFCVGPTSTGKSYVFQLLARHTAAFTPCLTNNERPLAGYSDDQYDWIFLNEFHDTIQFQILSTLCEGSELKINDYGRQVTKLNNCPVVFTANTLPQYKNLDPIRRTALLNRLRIINFHTAHMYEEDAVQLKKEDLFAWLAALTF